MCPFYLKISLSSGKKFIISSIYRMFFKLYICVVILCVFLNDGLCDELNTGRMTIELHRQKTPFEQHINNAPFLKKHGINVDWLYKKRHPHKGEPRTNDSIALKRYLDNEFYGSIVIGHPGQTLYVSFDTSWTLSWVMSSQCQVWYNIGCLFHNRYDHTKSSYYKEDPQHRTIVQQDGNYNLSGNFLFENISIAHSNVTNFLFPEMTEVPFPFLFSKIDGVLGLGLQTQMDAYVPFFYAMVAQKKIKDPVFSIYLNRDKQSSKGGNVILGFIEMRHVHKKKDPATNKTIYDPIKYMPVKPNNNGFWKFDLDSVIVNMEKESPITFCGGDTKCTAITDTSSNNIMGPKDFVDKIHTAIKARPFFLDRHTVNCDTVNKLPVITFTIGGQNFTLKGRDYTVKMSYLSITICLSAFVPNEYTDMWTLGGAFLSEYYTIYKIQEKQIGIVKCA